MGFPHQPILPGVLYRTGLTDADYDEAIEALRDAKMQPAHMSQGCTVCNNADHFAHQCHHNPLVMARRAVMAAKVWRCYHCNEVFTDHAAAEAHFGKSEHEAARCLERQANEDRYSEEQLKKMINDPRYWKSKDPTFIAKVAEGFRHLYADSR